MKIGMVKQILAVTLAALTGVSGSTAMLPAVAVYAEEDVAESATEEAAGAAADEAETETEQTADAEETETEQTLEIEFVVYGSTVVLRNETGVDVTVEFVEEDAEAAGVEAAAEDGETEVADAEAVTEEAEPEDGEAAAEDSGEDSTEEAPGYLVVTDEDGEQHIFEDVDLLAATDPVLTVEDDVFYLNYLDENMEECSIAESSDEDGQESADGTGQEEDAEQRAADEATDAEQSAADEAADAEQNAADAASAAAEAAVRAAAEAAASGGDGEKTEVSRQKYDDCDGSGHGYYEITYSDGSTEIEEY